MSARPELERIDDRSPERWRVSAAAEAAPPPPSRRLTPEQAVMLQRSAGNRAVQRMLATALSLRSSESRQLLRDDLGEMLAGTAGPSDVGDALLLQLPARDFYRQRQLSKGMRARIDGLLLRWLKTPELVESLQPLFASVKGLRDVPMLTLLPAIRNLPSGLDANRRLILIRFLAERPTVEWPALLKVVPEEAVELAVKLGLEMELACAVRCGGDTDLIRLVFTTLAPKDLMKLPQTDTPLWQQLTGAALLVAPFGGLRRWLARLKLAVGQLPGFLMLLTDKQSQAADMKARAKLETAPVLPKFDGMDYDRIVEILLKLGFVRQEKYDESRAADKGAGPYGQDVWTHDSCLLVRLKLGGRSLSGRFTRPPHVVKEITATPHAYGARDVICKMTDDNILIPAGTKYSAKDMQTWYMKVTGANLPANAWEKPADCGDKDFIDLVQMWAEGAHTAIGAVPKF